MNTETKPDPNEMLQLPPMKRSDIANLMACIDRVLRAEGLAAGDLVALAAKLSEAKPVVAHLAKQTII